MPAETVFRHDPAAVLDYVFDWSAWLAAGETITAATVTADTGITIDNDTVEASKVTVWLSGGTAKARYQVRCSITTTLTREDRRHITIAVSNR